MLVFELSVLGHGGFPSHVISELQYRLLLSIKYRENCFCFDIKLQKGHNEETS